MERGDAGAPSLSFAFEARVTVGPEEHIGHGAGDEALFVPITGGCVDGPRLRGTIVPGGGDWMDGRARARVARRPAGWRTSAGPG